MLRAIMIPRTASGNEWKIDSSTRNLGMRQL